ncbi:MAG: aminopeptidase N, partial [Candidatus Electrothrix sp. LOE2]|nr:aminopeptidase N [Candidatus Electrothrix sp. LOE2]
MKQHSTKYLQDYRPYPFTLSTVDLRFELAPDRTRVVARTAMERNPLSRDSSSALELSGEHLELISVRIDEHLLTDDEYSYDGHQLLIPEVPDRFTLEVETVINPQANTALEGLYLSSGNYCTQCEAQG